MIVSRVPRQGRVVECVAVSCEQSNAWSPYNSTVSGEVDGSDSISNQQFNIKSNEKANQNPNCHFFTKPYLQSNGEPNGKTYKAGDKISKNGKEYWWCPHHHDDGMWCRHKPATCTKNPNRSNEHNSPASSPPNCNNNDVANAATEYEDTTEDVEGLLGNFIIESDDDLE